MLSIGLKNYQINANYILIKKSKISSNNKTLIIKVFDNFVKLNY